MVQSYLPGWANVYLHPGCSNRHPHCNTSAPCWVALSMSAVGHVLGWPLLLSKLPLHVWDLYPCLIHDSLGPLKITASHVGSEPLSNTWFLGPTNVHVPNSISIGSAVFVGLIVVPDRQIDGPTDRPCYSVCSSGPHLASAVIRPEK